MKYLRGFLILLSFFTRIPIGKFVKYDEEDYSSGCYFFPLIGFVVGFFLVALSYFSSRFGIYSPLLMIIAYLALTGAIHLDGFADSFDGLFSGRSRERILEIMSDPHMGVFGVISLIIAILALYNGFSNVGMGQLFIFSFIGRSAAYFATSFSNYARSDGMGKIFVERANKYVAGVYFVISLAILPLFIRGYDLPRAVFGVLAAYFVSLMSAYVSSKRIGGITGDVIGMCVEISQIAFLVFAV